MKDRDRPTIASFANGNDVMPRDVFNQYVLELSFLTRVPALQLREMYRDDAQQLASDLLNISRDYRSDMVTWLAFAVPTAAILLGIAALPLSAAVIGLVAGEGIAPAVILGGAGGLFAALGTALSGAICKNFKILNKESREQILTRISEKTGTAIAIKQKPAAENNPVVAGLAVKIRSCAHGLAWAADHACAALYTLATRNPARASEKRAAVNPPANVSPCASDERQQIVETLAAKTRSYTGKLAKAADNACAALRTLAALPTGGPRRDSLNSSVNRLFTLARDQLGPMMDRDVRQLTENPAASVSLVESFNKMAAAASHQIDEIRWADAVDMQVEAEVLGDELNIFMPDPVHQLVQARPATAPEPAPEFVSVDQRKKIVEALAAATLDFTGELAEAADRFHAALDTLASMPAAGREGEMDKNVSALFGLVSDQLLPRFVGLAQKPGGQEANPRIAAAVKDIFNHVTSAAQKQIDLMREARVDADADAMEAQAKEFKEELAQLLPQGEIMPVPMPSLVAA